jgi:hypothetical protein
VESRKVLTLPGLELRPSPGLVGRKKRRKENGQGRKEEVNEEGRRGVHIQEEKVEE